MLQRLTFRHATALPDIFTTAITANGDILGTERVGPYAQHEVIVMCEHPHKPGQPVLAACDKGIRSCGLHKGCPSRSVPAIIDSAIFSAATLCGSFIVCYPL